MKWLIEKPSFFFRKFSISDNVQESFESLPFLFLGGLLGIVNCNRVLESGNNFCFIFRITYKSHNLAVEKLYESVPQEVHFRMSKTIRIINN